jgi:sortase B
MRKIINLILIIIIFICTYKIYQKLNDYRESDKLYEEIRIVKEEDDNFKNISKDYRGWIKVDDTNIDYPILQSTDNLYYLNKDINGDYLAAGSIFMDCDNNNFEDKNTILYGHNMKNKSMFYSLRNFKEENFFDGKNIIIETASGQTLEYEVFSAYITDASFNYIQTEFNGDFKTFLQNICEKSMHKSNIEVDENDKIITLSTCSYEFDNARMVVHGKLKKGA